VAKGETVSEKMVLELLLDNVWTNSFFGKIFQIDWKKVQNCQPFFTLQLFKTSSLEDPSCRN